MATRTKVTSQKRNRERARQEAQKEKARRRAAVKEQKASAPRRAGDEDPDLAGIVAGPQPHPWAEEGEFDDVEEEEGGDEAK